MSKHQSVPHSDSESILRDLILGDRIKEPIIFRGLHKESWSPCRWSLKDWGRIFEDKNLRLRCGERDWRDRREPQWESQCREVEMNWDDFLSWDHVQDADKEREWRYFDYKYMHQLFSEEELKIFHWKCVGFPERDGSDSTIWIGTEGAYTPCHFDTYGSNFVTQVYGKKRWLLFPPEDSKQLSPTRIPYEESSVYSSINFTNAAARSGLAKRTQGREIILEPGDVLYVPPKWWHFVSSESFSISINTWIPLAGDNATRMEEAIARTLLHALAPLCQDLTKVLNPNELDLMRTQPQELEVMLGSVATTLLNQDKTEENADPLPKRVKLTSDPENTAGNGSETFLTIAELRTLVKIHLEPLPRWNSNESGPEIPVESANPVEIDIFPHLINAITHPTILKQISGQFLAYLHHSKH